MLARLEHPELDAGPRRTAPERLCIARRTVRPVSEMIRFVVGPDGTIVPDVKHKLPGRGAWVSANRADLEQAVKRKAFGRTFKREVRLPPDLVEVTERLLERAALDSLAIAHKAGLVVAGFAKVAAALAQKPVVALIHAAGASPEGVRKLDGIVQGRFSERPDRPRTIDMLTTTQLDLALGRSNVVHAALLAGAA